MAIPQTRAADTEPASGFQHLLALRDFRLIWFAQVAAQLADKFLMFSLIILAYRLSGGSTEVAITLLAYTLPAVAIAPLAGVLADRWDRKLIMVVTNLARAGLIALIPLSSLVPALGHDYVHLLALTFAFAAVGQLFSPAEAASIPSVVPREGLITANSMVLATMVITLVVGAPLAPIVSRFDIYSPYWIAVALFGGAGMLILFARIPAVVREPSFTHRHPFKQLFLELKEGMDTLRRSPVLLLTFYQLSLAVLVMFVMLTLAPAYVTQVIGIGELDTYVILAPATVGALASAAILGQLGRHLSRPRLLVMALLGTGLTLLVLAAVPSLLGHFDELHQWMRWFGAAFSLLLGLEFGAMMIPALSYLMEHTSDSVRGRVFSMFFMVVNGATALPVLLTAALSDVIGTNRVIGGLGVVLAATGLLTARYARRVFGSPTEPG
jgi:MFS family permease